MCVATVDTGLVNLTITRQRLTVTITRHEFLKYVVLQFMTTESFRPSPFG